MEYVDYYRTKKGLLTNIYCNQKKKAKIRGHDKPDYSKDEFFEWALFKKEFHDLFDSWVNSGYNRDFSPSFDRIDDYVSYRLDNLKVVRFRDNYKRYHSDAINGVNTKNCKNVLKFDTKGEFLDEYYSAHNAARMNGLDFSAICKACRGDYKTSGGFVWKYKSNLSQAEKESLLVSTAR